MTGFFDLPLELRQRIYEEILPDDRMLTIDPERRHKEQETVGAVSRALGKRLRREFELWTMRQCGLRIVVTPGSPPPRATMPFDKFRRLELYIDYYKSAAKYHPVGRLEDLTDTYRPFDNQKNLKALHDKVVLITNMLAKYPELRNLSVEFREEPYDDEFGDDHWCRRVADVVSSANEDDIISRGSVYDGMEDGSMSVIEYLLRPLMDLPVCDRIYIFRPIANVVDDLFNEYKFDNWHMEKLCRILELWLGGRRSVPFNEYRQSFGDTREEKRRLSWESERRYTIE